jgi:hypothetical protein
MGMMNNQRSGFSGGCGLNEESFANLIAFIGTGALSCQILFDMRFKTWSIPEHVKNEYLQFCAYIKTFYFQMVVQRLLL